MLEDSSRVIDPTDFSVRPSRDTGFRMTPQTIVPYIRKTVPTDPHLFVDCVHNDDMKDIGQGTLNGQPLNAVRCYSIDFDAVEQRVINEIRRNTAIRIIREHGDSPCLCKPIPSSVPCTDCGAGC